MLTRSLVEMGALQEFTGSNGVEGTALVLGAYAALRVPVQQYSRFGLAARYSDRDPVRDTFPATQTLGASAEYVAGLSRHWALGFGVQYYDQRRRTRRTTTDGLRIRRPVRHLQRRRELEPHGPLGRKDAEQQRAMQNNPLIKEYLDIAFRRRWWIVVPALLGILFATLLYLRFPKLYKATTRATIRPQTISKHLLSPIVEIQSTELVNSLNAEITSEKNVTDLDSRLKLVGTPKGPRDLAELARKLDGAIDLQANARNRFFDLTVTWEDPRIAANIANELADIYIKRTESARQSLASETLDKLTEIRELAEKRLGEIQTQIDQFQGAHKFEIDAYRDTNLQRLGVVRTEIDRIDTRVRGYEDDIRRLEIELQSGGTIAGPGGGPVVDPRTIELARLKQELAEQASLGRTEIHPEIKTRRDRIAILEQQLAATPPGSPDAPAASDPARAQIRREIDRLNREIAADSASRQRLVAESGMIQSPSSSGRPTARARCSRCSRSATASSWSTATRSRRSATRAKARWSRSSSRASGSRS